MSASASAQQFCASWESMDLPDKFELNQQSDDSKLNDIMVNSYCAYATRRANKHKENEEGLPYCLNKALPSVRPWQVRIEIC